MSRASNRDGSVPSIAVLDYGIGNLRSAEKALQHLGAPATLVSVPEVAARADAVVLPGVGAFGACARALRSSGLDAVARDALGEGKPFLGICVGFQLLYEASVESPGEVGLGHFGGTVEPLPDAVKRPQMQWNRLAPVEGGGSAPDSAGNGPGLFSGLGPEPWVYFVHSYVPPIGPETVGTCDYGGTVSAAVQAGPVWGTQFHPEKSGRTGLAVLANWVRLAGAA